MRRSGDYYDTMQVCLNGHQITAFYDTSPENRKDHCSDCGAKTIAACEVCEAPIRGHHHMENVLFVGETEVPRYCHKCGSPYPWAKKKEISSKVQSAAPDPVDVVRLVCERFHLVASQLRTRHDARPTLQIEDEYDAQDLLCGLLKLFFDDVRPEEWTPSYAGGSSRMDFLLKNEKLVVEAKKTRSGLRDKEVADQLLVDMARYKEHPDCKRLICMVYDPDGILKNPRGLESDLSLKDAKFPVHVIVVP